MPYNDEIQQKSEFSGNFAVAIRFISDSDQRYIQKVMSSRVGEILYPTTQTCEKQELI
jgi:hypothetical protein